MNSSIAAGAGEAAAIDAALPIASADAQTASREHMQERDLRVQQIMQERGLTHDEAQRESDREHATQLQREDLYVRQIMQGRDISSREIMQSRDHDVQQLMQERGFSHTEALQASKQSFARAQAEADRSFKSEQDAFRREHETSIQDTELDVRQLMQTQHLTQEEAQAELDRQQREADREFRLDYQQREIDHQQNVSRVQDYEGAADRYAQSVANITNNVNIPAAERQRQILEARNIRDRAIDAIDGIYGTDTEW